VQKLIKQKNTKIIMNVKDTYRELEKQRNSVSRYGISATAAVVLQQFNTIDIVYDACTYMFRNPDAHYDLKQSVIRGAVIMALGLGPAILAMRADCKVQSVGKKLKKCSG
jgi:hypothetical protein